MEIHLSRTEIRRRVHARMGFSDSQAVMVQSQHDEFIRAANLEVAQSCPWVNTQDSERVTIGIDQQLVNYPTGATAGSVIQIGVWDPGSSQYLVMRRGIIPVALDEDPIVDEGEPASVAGRGMPQLYELKEQIRTFPRADQEYELKITFSVLIDLAAETTESKVDAEAIILLTCAEIYAFQGDEVQARFHRAKYDERIRKLSQAQRHDLTISRKAQYRRRTAGMPGPLGDYEPNSGAWPSTTPT